jgi:cell pole-organizing protein PopZ
MANEAHKEPTMEEILASIRKIISDDEPAPARQPSPTAAFRDAPLEPVNDYEDIEDAIAGDVLEDTDQSFFEASSDASPEPEPVKLTGPEFSFEEMLGSARHAAAQAPVEPAPVTPITRAAPVRPAFNASETAMTTSARYAHTALTDEHTADVAAGALGKLISKMEISTDNNTIEGLVRDLLKPMIKEWLDANLPGIVEEKVEAEVQRIARMAR